MHGARVAEHMLRRRSRPSTRSAIREVARSAVALIASAFADAASSSTLEGFAPASESVDGQIFSSCRRIDALGSTLLVRRSVHTDGIESVERQRLQQSNHSLSLECEHIEMLVRAHLPEQFPLQEHFWSLCERVPPSKYNKE